MSFTSLQQLYNDNAVATLKKELGTENVMSLPRISKVVVNVGVGKLRKEKKLLELLIDDMTAITGQKMQIRRARLSIAGFSIREGDTVGIRSTLRGKRMYDFLDRMVHIAFPRTRDFNGINPKSIDRQGNLSIGIKEHIAFPEIAQDKSEKIFSFEVTITTTAKTKEEGEALFKALNFPINWENN